MVTLTQNHQIKYFILHHQNIPINNPLVMEKVFLASESLFQPANGMQRTRLLVEIHNIQVFDA